MHRGQLRHEIIRRVLRLLVASRVARLRVRVDDRHQQLFVLLEEVLNSLHEPVARSFQHVQRRRVRQIFRASIDTQDVEKREPFVNSRQLLNSKQKVPVLRGRELVGRDSLKLLIQVLRVLPS